MKTPATLIAVVEGGKKIVLHRREWMRKAWTTMVQDAEFNKLFGAKDGKLHAGKCHGCNRDGMIRTLADKVHPEVVRIAYDCLLCGYEDTDVMD